MSPATDRAPNPHQKPAIVAERLLCTARMTEITKWRDPATRRGVHQFAPGLPEPPRTTNLSRSPSSRSDIGGRALEEWLDGLAVASTVDGE